MLRSQGYCQVHARTKTPHRVPQRTRLSVGAKDETGSLAYRLFLTQTRPEEGRDRDPLTPLVTFLVEEDEMAWRGRLLIPIRI